MLSRSYFQVPVSFTIIGSIASSTLKFIYNTRHEVVIQTIFKTEIIWFIWFLNTIWILEQLNVLLRTFWSFVLVWRDNFPRKGRTSVRVFFSAVKTSGRLRYSRSKNVLKHLSMNDIGYPFFKNMSFRNTNSLWKLVQLEQIEKHLKTKACSR